MRLTDEQIVALAQDFPGLVRGYGDWNVRYRGVLLNLNFFHGLEDLKDHLRTISLEER